MRLDLSVWSKEPQRCGTMLCDYRQSSLFKGRDGLMAGDEADSYADGVIGADAEEGSALCEVGGKFGELR